jgi:hypothetical protein
MPPGAFHCVYTRKNSLFMGWHEYSFNTLSQTEISRFYDANNSERTTNIDHPSVYEIVDQMVYYLLRDEDNEIRACSAYHPIC